MKFSKILSTKGISIYRFFIEKSVCVLENLISTVYSLISFVDFTRTCAYKCGPSALTGLWESLGTINFSSSLPSLSRPPHTVTTGYVQGSGWNRWWKLTSYWVLLYLFTFFFLLFRFSFFTSNAFFLHSSLWHESKSYGDRRKHCQK